MAKIASNGSQQPNYVYQAHSKNQQGPSGLTAEASTLANKVKSAALPTIKLTNQLSYSRKYPNSIAKEVGSVAAEAFEKLAQIFKAKRTKTPQR
ncbi:MAG: hypothetical protein NTX49_07235 [Chlamydiae bacterium]|nr:hypothetical protein [Chlamydiota bacterium]